MSLTRKTSSAEKPTKKYIKFKNGEFGFWDKYKAELVPINLPIRFVILDELATITGFHKKDKCGIYSNEVHYTTKEKLKVRTFEGTNIAEGLYAEIKDKVNAQGGRFARSLYAMMDGEIVNFQLSGASFASFLNAQSEEKTNTMEVTEVGEGKEGGVKYKFPIFKYVPDDGEEIKKAEVFDMMVQEYLDVYKESNTDNEDEEGEEIKTEEKDDTDKIIENAKKITGIKYQSDIKAEDLPF